MVGDVTNLPAATLGSFDFFLDIGCFQGLGAGQRLGEGRGVTALAGPGATLLMPAGTAGLGWPLNSTAPQWYRLRPKAGTDRRDQRSATSSTTRAGAVSR